MPATRARSIATSGIIHFDWGRASDEVVLQTWRRSDSGYTVTIDALDLRTGEAAPDGNGLAISLSKTSHDIYIWEPRPDAEMAASDPTAGQ